ncbi:MAG: transposase [Lentisphaeraceae bacterium]|nr:transposase [Lentisphaeraceae bacterium]
MIDVYEDRTKAAVNTLSEEVLSYKQRRSIKAISMDIWGVFTASAKLIVIKREYNL